MMRAHDASSPQPFSQNMAWDGGTVCARQARGVAEIPAGNLGEQNLTLAGAGQVSHVPDPVTAVAPGAPSPVAHAPCA